MIRRPAFRSIAAVCLLLLVTACAGSDADNTPPFTAGTAAPTFSMPDPVEFVLTFNEQLANQNWDAVRSMLIEEFRQFDDVFLQNLGFGIPTDAAEEADDWAMERHERFTTVRIKDQPVIAIVLREVDGSWLVDPGPHRLAMAKLRASGITNWGGSRFQFDRTGFAEQDPVTFTRYLHEHIEQVGIQDGDVDITLSWLFERGATGELPVRNMTWSAADKSGLVEVTWTTAKLTDGLLTFPKPESGEDAPSYEATLSLQGVPQAEEILLRIDRMRLSAPDIDESEFSTMIHVPMETYPQPARVEVPGSVGTPAN